MAICKDPVDPVDRVNPAVTADEEIAWAVPGVGPAPSIDLVAAARDRWEQFVDDATGQGQAEHLVAMRALIDSLEAAFLAGCAHFDTAGGPAEDGATSLAAWLRHRCRLSPGQAQSRARLAHATTTGALTLTGEAMRAGRLSWRHAAVIEATVRDVPTEHRAQAEQALQEPARTLDPGLLRRVGAELLHALDVDRAEAQAVQRLERRGLTCSPTLDGMVAGALVMTALNAKTKPTTADQPGHHGGDGGDPADQRPALAEYRTWAQQRADALAEICQEWLDLADTNHTGGQRPHLSVIVDINTLRNQPGAAPGQLCWVGPITANQTRQLACDAVISRIVTDGPSQILDVGRATRTIPPAIRRAVIARDRTCIAPGCHRPPEHCDIHHIIFWESGGTTALPNLALLCRRHHTYTHHNGWHIKIGPHGTPTLAPP